MNELAKTPKREAELFTHQTSGIEYGRAHSHIAILDEPGLGKSLQALHIAEGRTCIVAPAMVIQGKVWDDELAKWAPELDATQVPYSQLMLRERTVGPTGRVGSKPTDKLNPELRRHWDTVIFDEAHYMKSRKTHWTKAGHALAALSERVILLTGTPIPNWAHEAFSLLQLLYPEECGPGKRLGSYWRWVEEYFTLGDVYGKGGQVVSHHGIEGLKPGVTWDSFNDDNWGDRAIRRLRKDCLDLPPMLESYRTYTMLPAQAKAYKEMQRDFITWLESGEEVSTLTASGQLAKLARFATGLEVEVPDAQPSSNKLDAMMEVIENDQRPTMVVAHFKASVRAAAARLKAAGHKVAVITGDTAKGARGRAVRAFQNGEIDYLCASLSTIAEGLTFTNCDRMIFLERSYRPSVNEQAMRRIHRIGQVRPVSIIHLVSANTVDENVIQLLKTKTDQQMAALSRMEMLSLVK